MTDQQADLLTETATDIVQRLATAGRMWASHGLRVGRSSLATAAKTLDLTATTLEELSDRIADEK